MDEIDRHHYLLEQVAVNRAQALAIFSAHIAAVFASIASDRSLIRGSQLAVKESEELLSRVKSQTGL